MLQSAALHRGPVRLLHIFVHSMHSAPSTTYPAHAYASRCCTIRKREFLSNLHVDITRACG